MRDPPRFVCRRQQSLVHGTRRIDKSIRMFSNIRAMALDLLALIEVENQYAGLPFPRASWNPLYE